MTPEREKEIRDRCEWTSYQTDTVIKELLTEIDELRVQMTVGAWDTVANLKFCLEGAKKECDELRAENCASLIGQEHILGTRIDRLEKDRYHLEEIMISITRERDTAIRGQIKLLERNIQLRAALDMIRDPRLREHTEHDTYTEMGCVMNIADQALIYDDKQ